MKAEAFREMGEVERHEKLAELQKQLFELRSQQVTETLPNPKAIINARRDIARLKTIMRETK